ncbi:MAG: DUF4212 domain-containing protein [Pseudomonadota bacterium]
MADQTVNPETHVAKDAAAYWAANVRIIVVSLIIWAVVSFGFGILLRPVLAGIDVGGTDLGFWFAQQGSILVFLALIFFYAWRMNKLDREYGVDED